MALEAGAEDVVRNEDGSLEVLTDPLDFETVRAQLAARWLPAARLARSRSAPPPPRRSTARPPSRWCSLLDTLEDLDDVQNVYSNAEIPNEVLARV